MPALHQVESHSNAPEATCTVLTSLPWAARYNSWLLNKLMPISPFLFCTDWSACVATGECPGTQDCNAQNSDAAAAAGYSILTGVCVTPKAAGAACEVGYGKDATVVYKPCWDQFSRFL